MKGKTVTLIVLALVVVAIITLKGATKPDETVSQSEQLLSEAKRKNQPVWLLFHSTTCQPCIEMDKVYNALKPKFEGKVAFVEVDVNDSAERDLIAQYQFQYIPTTFFLDSKGTVTFNQVGVISEEEMRDKLQALAEDN